MNQLKSFVVMLGCIAASEGVLASGPEGKKNNGVVHGYVIDGKTKKPVAGVVVTTNSSKQKGNQEVATDSDGYFKLKELPAGDFAIQFEKKGYRNLKKETVSMKDGAVIKLTV